MRQNCLTELPIAWVNDCDDCVATKLRALLQLTVPKSEHTYADARIVTRSPMTGKLIFYGGTG